MGNRSRHKSRKNYEPADPLDSATNHRPGDPIVAIMRPNCSQCGSPIEWLSPEQATARGIDLTKAFTFLGVSTGSDADVWFCATCGEHGVMSTPEFGAL